MNPKHFFLVFTRQSDNVLPGTVVNGPYIFIYVYFIIFLFLIIWELLLKTFIPVSRIFENEDDIFIFSKNVRMRRKINDDYLLSYLNDLFLELNWFFYDPSWMWQLSEFSWTLCSSTWVVFNNFLHKDATDRSNISSDQKRLLFAVSQYPLLYFTNTPFNFLLIQQTINIISRTHVVALLD